MLVNLKNQDRVFRQLRLVAILCVLGMVATAMYSVYFVSKAQREASSTVYALLGDNAVSLRAVDIIENRPVEARSHISKFHQHLFSLDPDLEVIARNTEAALSMADESVRRLVNTYEEENYYRNIVSSNISQRLTIDSISLDMSSYPYFFTYRGQLTITRTTSEVTRSLVAEGFFRDVQRSRANPHGFLIEGYRILENSDIRVERRYTK